MLCALNTIVYLPLLYFYRKGKNSFPTHHLNDGDGAIGKPHPRKIPLFLAIWVHRNRTSPVAPHEPPNILRKFTPMPMTNNWRDWHAMWICQTCWRMSAECSWVVDNSASAARLRRSTRRRRRRQVLCRRATFALATITNTHAHAHVPTLFYLTYLILPLGQAVSNCPLLRLYLYSQTHNSNVTTETS